MSRNERNYRQASYEKERGVRTADRNRGAYVYGNTVRKLEPVRRPDPDVKRQQDQRKVRRNRDKAHHMSAGYVLFLAVALCTAAVILVNYIQLQAELTNLTKRVASQQSQLNNMRISNDEAYNRVLNSIDLEEVKRIAIGELGMVYAEEGQIITYTPENNDYMRQVIDSSR